MLKTFATKSIGLAAQVCAVRGANIIILLFQNGDVNFDRRDVMTMRYDSALRAIHFKSKPNK